MDEWRDCYEDKERIGTLTELPVPSLDTQNERFSCFVRKLEREMKLHLFSKKVDPCAKLQIDVDKDIFEKFVNSVANNGEKRNRFSVQKKELDVLEWDTIILNKHLNFCYGVPGTIQFWTKKKSPISEFKIISAVPIESQIER